MWARNLAASLLVLGAVASADPVCSSSSSNTTCLEILPLAFGSSTFKLPVMRTHPLGLASGARDALVKRALVVQHFRSRDAFGLLKSAITAGSRAGKLQETVIVAPWFSCTSDPLPSDVLMWGCDSITAYRPPTSPAAATSAVDYIKVYDNIALQLAKVFPNLDTIVFSGLSAGGQVIARCESHVLFPRHCSFNVVLL
jgi:hypothetical protein